MTTIKDANSRVDFVWINDDAELRRVEGVIGKSTTNNSVVYTDQLITPTLSVNQHQSTTHGYW